MRRVFALLLAVGIAAPAQAAFVAFSVGGDATFASITPTVDAFRSALGARQEINWDGGGATTTTPPVTPFLAFTNTRGATFTTPGTGLTQATLDGLSGLSSINPSYATTFSAFSPLRVFTAVGSNIIDVSFFVPGSNGTIPATVSGFGSVFSDVDLANATSIQLFDAASNLLQTSFVQPDTVSQQGFSFLGLLAGAGEQIARVRITAGNAALGPSDSPTNDVVVLDDVLYSQPVGGTQAIPEPATYALMLLALAALLLAQSGFWLAVRRYTRFGL